MKRQQKYSNAEVVLRNVWNWEQNFDSITPAQLMNGYLTVVNNVSAYKSHLSDKYGFIEETLTIK